MVPEALGLGNWVKAQEWAALPDGQATYLGNPVPWGTLPTILVIEFLSIAFVEHQRSMEKDTEKKKYPGGAFDPLGYSKDPVKFKEYKIKEIKNGLSLNPYFPILNSNSIYKQLIRLICYFRSSRFVGFRGFLCATIGLPRNWTVGEFG